RAGAHGRTLRALRGRFLALVAAAREDASTLAREELLKVRAGDLVELETQLAGQLGDIPEHVPELLGHRLAALVCDDPRIVADRLLGVLGDLAGLAGQPERGVGEPGLARVLGGSARELLIVGELDGGDRNRRRSRIRRASMEFAERAGALQAGGAKRAQVRLTLERVLE